MGKSSTVLITGISGGIGSAIASLFKNHDWRVIGLDLTAPPTACDKFYEGDVAEATLFQQVQSDLRQERGTLNCIVNAAAQQIEAPLLETTQEQWSRIFAVNVGSVFLAASYLTEFMTGGSIINISSVHARATSIGLSAYAASKGALSALTRSMALELGTYDIRVNAILPGAIDTPMLQRGLSRNGSPEAALKKIVESSPLKRVGVPDDVAQLCWFLADPRLSANITGQEFICDSGVLARLPSE